MTERPRAGLDARDLACVRMTVEPRERLHEVRELVFREEAAARQRDVESRRTVALAQDEAVPLRVVGLARVEPEHAVVERGQDVGRRQVAADVPESGGVYHLDVAAASLLRELPQPGHVADSAGLEHSRFYSSDPRN